MDSIKDIAREICAAYDIRLSSESLNQFASVIEVVKLLRGKTAFEVGQVCPFMYYVKRGLVLQHYDKNGIDMVEHISHEGDMVICLESIFKNQPCNIEVKMLEPSIMYAIPYNKLVEMGKENSEINTLLFAILERSLILSQHKADMLRFEKAKDRYKRMLAENPELVRRSPLRYIASLLQMKPETLSRVRTQVMNEGIL